MKVLDHRWYYWDQWDNSSDARVKIRIGGTDHPSQPAALRTTHHNVTSVGLEDALLLSELTDCLHGLEGRFRHRKDKHLPRVMLRMLNHAFERPG
jgi:hypothetical protein